MLLVLLALLPIAEPGAKIRFVFPGLVAAAGVAAAIDLVILRFLRRSWEFPSGAVLSGLFVAMVLSPHEPWYVPAATAAIAVVSKYIFRTKSANIFNPAAFGLVVTVFLFNTGQSWWGALPEITPYALIVLFAAGVFISDRVKKIPLVLMFLGIYFLLFTVISFLSDPQKAAEIFRAPDLHASLFFAFFILTDPPTSPVAYRDQLIYGAIVAVASFAVFELIGAVYYLLAGVLVGNIWEAWRRRYHMTHRHRSGTRAAQPQHPSFIPQP